MAEDVNAAQNLYRESNRKIRKDVVEIPFWLFPDKPKWVSGVQPHTTCHDILLSLIRSDPTKTFFEDEVRCGHLVLLEQWRGVEKPLGQRAKILKIWNAWGKERHEVRFVVKRLSSARLSKMEKQVDSADHLRREKELIERSSKTYRKLRRQRNSISSMDSILDNQHPKRLDKLHHKVPIHPEVMTQKAFEIVRKTDALLEEHGNVNHFDEHIEEMMKIIVSQGRLICKELKKLQHHGDTLEQKDKKLKSRYQANVVSQNEFPEVKTIPDRTNSPVNIGEESLDKENCLPVNFIGQNNNESCSENSKSESCNSSCKISEDNKILKRSCRILPKIPLNAVKFDLSQSFVDIPTNAKVSDEYFQNSSYCLDKNTTRSTLKRASSSWDVLPQQVSQCSTRLKPSQKANFSSKLDLKQKKIELIENPDSSEENHSDPSSKSRGYLKQGSSFLSKSLFKNSSKIDTENQKLDVEPKQSFSASEMALPNPSGFSDNISSSMTATCHSDFHFQTNFKNMYFNQAIRLDQSTKNPDTAMDFSVLKKDTSLSDYYSMENSKLSSISNPDSITSSDKLDDTIAQMRLFSEELSRLIDVNERLQFSEENADQIQAEIHLQEHLAQKSGQPPNFLQTSGAAQEHLMCARSEVIRLRVMNENVAREISGNQKQLHNLDSAVKSRRAILKHLEYDVNVIEKEGRKLAKELEKVLKIRIDKVFTHDEIKREGDAIESDEIESELCIRQESDTTRGSSGTLFDSSIRILATSSPESSSSGTSSRTNSEMTGTSTESKPSKTPDCNGENDSNSDTGLSSLHSSSDEGSYEVGTLV